MMELEKDGDNDVIRIWTKGTEINVDETMLLGILKSEWIYNKWQDPKINSKNKKYLIFKIKFQKN